PVKLSPGVPSPLADVKSDDIDLVVVRENTEGVYVGAGGTVHRGGPAEAATETSIGARAGVGRGRAGRLQSGPGPGSSGSYAMPPPRPRSGPAGSPWSTRPTCSCTPATSGSGRRRRSPPRPGSPST